MSKVKIKIVFLGHIPHSIDIDKIVKWQSELFEIMKPINTVAIVGNSDGAYWEFLDENIEEQLPSRDGADILLAVTNVPLQSNYFARRFADNRVCMTYSTMTEILKFDNIPLENLLFRVLYSVAFVYRRYGNRMPLMTEDTNFTHDETRGCIFDMNGVKTDVVYSLNGPQLCHSCVENLTTTPKYKIEKEVIDKVQGELKKIKKGLYYQLTDFIKRRPIFGNNYFISCCNNIGCHRLDNRNNNLGEINKMTISNRHNGRLEKKQFQCLNEVLCIVSSVLIQENIGVS